MNRTRNTILYNLVEGDFLIDADATYKVVSGEIIVYADNTFDSSNGELAPSTLAVIDLNNQICDLRI